MKKSVCLIFCCIIVWVHGAPTVKERRVSRDLDKIDGLRARLLRLRNQIDALANSDDTKTSDGGREKGSRGDADDVSAEDDVSQLREGTEATMTSARQQHVQKLARTLGDDRGSNLKTLAETLSQLLREQEDKDQEAGESLSRSNTAGEYLGDNYNSRRYGSSAHASRNEKEEVEENNNDKYDVEIDDGRLQNIYNMLLRMYDDQQSERIAMETQKRQQQRYLPDVTRATSYHSVPVVHVDEGSFGDFVGYGADDDRSATDSRSSSSHSMRDAVLSAVERRLLTDVQDARAAGVSVDDIIKDIKKKAADELKREQLKEIENELNSLSRSRL